MSMNIDSVKVKDLELTEPSEKILVTNSEGKVRASSLDASSLNSLEGISSSETIETRLGAIDLYLGEVEEALTETAIGPVTSTDNAIARFDGVTGKALNNSPVTINDLGQVAGITWITADYSYSKTRILTANYLSAHTGLGVTLSEASVEGVIRLADGVESIAGLEATEGGRETTLINVTSDKVIILNDSALATLPEYRIHTGTGKDVVLPPQGTFRFIYNETTQRHQLIGGTGSGSSQTLSTVLQLTADDSTSDWTASPSFQISKANPLQGDASYALAMTAGDKATHKGVAVNPVFRQRTLALVMSYKGVSLNPITGTAKIVLRDQADAIIYEAALPAITSEIQKFGDRVFIPSTVTSVKFEIEATSTVADESIQFDSIELSGDLLKSVDISNITDWQDFTPTGSWTTNTAYIGKWRRVGDSAEIKYQVNLSGVPNSTGLLLNIPDVIGVIDASKTLTSDNFSIIGNATDNSALTHYPITGSVQSATSLNVQTIASPKALVNQVTPFAFSATDNITLTAKLPIKGWSSTVKSIVAPTDQVSEKSLAFRWRSSATHGITEANLSTAGRIGDYVTGQYAASTNTLTQCTTRPTQTDADMSVNGLRIYARPFNVASTAALPARFAVKIAEPNQMIACDLTLYKDAARLITGNLDQMAKDTFYYGLSAYEFNPSTGILTLDIGFTVVTGAAPTSRNIIFADGTYQTNGYLTFTASKLAQAVAIPKTNPVAILKDVKPAGTEGGTATAGAWYDRVLNTIEDPYGIVTSFAANKFKLSKGKYLVEGDGAFLRVNACQNRILGSLGSELLGSAEYSQNDTANTSSRILGTLSISTIEEFSFQYRVGVTNASYGLGGGGVGNSWASHSFAEIKITKLD